MKKDWLEQFFGYAHLPPQLAAVSKPFADLAQQQIVDTLPRNPERTVALRKLLEAKDCAVRAFIGKEPVEEPAPNPPHASGAV